MPLPPARATLAVRLLSRPLNSHALAQPALAATAAVAPIGFGIGLWVFALQIVPIFQKNVFAKCFSA